MRVWIKSFHEFPAETATEERSAEEDSGIYLQLRPTIASAAARSVVVLHM